MGRRQASIWSAAVLLVLSLTGPAVGLAALPPGGTFLDDDGSIFEGAIEAIAAEGITIGCNPPANDRFCPNSHVTRGEMAVLLVRAMGYTADDGDLFIDDDGFFYENAANKLGAAGVTVGCNPPLGNRYCGQASVTRGQMAALLVRAMGYTADDGDLFIDDDGHLFEKAIDKLGTAGVTQGCNPPRNDRYCPDDFVTRGQMAAFLARALKLSPIYPPPRSDGELLVIGDWGSSQQAETDVAEAMKAHAAGRDIAAIVTTGDNFYSDDTQSMMAPYQWAVDSGVQFWISWGNHDIEDASRIASVNSVFGDPPRWTTIPWGTADIVILDSNQIGSMTQQAYLEDQLADSARPTVVVFHHPAYSCSNHGDTAAVIDSWIPLFDDDVVLVLNGHDHNYQRFRDNGVTYVVTGGGGRALYDLKACSSSHPTREAGESVHHFLSVEQAGNTLAVEAIDANGTVIDSFSVPLP